MLLHCTEGGGLLPIEPLERPIMTDNTTALVPYQGDGLDQATSWAHLTDEDRRRQAVAAAHTHDADALWRLTENWLLLNSRKKATISAYTLCNYRRGVHALLAAWREENLLHPGRMAASVWLSQMTGAGLKPATMQVHLAAARALYAALRTTGATSVIPLGGVSPNPRKFRHAKSSLVTITCSLQCAGDLANFPYVSR